MNYSTIQQTTSEPFELQVREIAGLHPHMVILHRDEENMQRLDYVVLALQVVVQTLSHEKAAGIVQSAFQKGRECIIACPLEQAEDYAARLNSKYALTVTVDVQA